MGFLNSVLGAVGDFGKKVQEKKAEYSGYSDESLKKELRRVGPNGPSGLAIRTILKERGVIQ